MILKKGISRRSFLATGVAVSAVGLVPHESWGAPSSSAHTATLARWIENGLIGSVEYIQLHCTPYFDLETALITVEQLTSNMTLNKVSALGDSDFTNTPKHVLASLYYKEGIRVTISSAASTRDSFGTILGDDGSIDIGKERVDLLHQDGSLIRSVAVSPKVLRGAHAFPMIKRALREGITVYPTP